MRGWGKEIRLITYFESLVSRFDISPLPSPLSLLPSPFSPLPFSVSSDDMANFIVDDDDDEEEEEEEEMNSESENCRFHAPLLQSDWCIVYANQWLAQINGRERVRVRVRVRVQ